MGPRPVKGVSNDMPPQVAEGKMFMGNYITSMAHDAPTLPR